MVPLLKVEDLVKHLRVRGGVVHAVDGVSFSLNPGETLGLVGESGCGKSTLGRLITRLLEPDRGRIELDGRDITHLSRRALRPIRSHMQMIFQDPFASLNPRSTIGRTLLEPFIVHRIGTSAERSRWVEDLLDRVGIRGEYANRYPHEFSGGQRQRIAIARALALNPKLIVCDEPVSSLDVSIQAQVLNLLQRLKEELHLSYVFITHDFAVMGHLADRIAVMYLGEFVELADRVTLRQRPLHPYTDALFGAVPIPEPRAARSRKRVLPKGDPPSPVNPPPGCRFHTRCPFAEDVCARETPPLREVETKHWVACHLVTVEPVGRPRGPVQMERAGGTSARSGDTSLARAEAGPMSQPAGSRPDA